MRGARLSLVSHDTRRVAPACDCVARLATTLFLVAQVRSAAVLGESRELRSAAGPPRWAVRADRPGEQSNH